MCIANIERVPAVDTALGMVLKLGGILLQFYL